MKSKLSEEKDKWDSSDVVDIGQEKSCYHKGFTGKPVTAR
ncbi:MAG TPA: hypothetical protein DEB17_05320 [Chlorobaculum sp.]|uniref:Uncharacterized protein n=1 Tax=Chlorobaculum tepidum (strain ATCC 49652 / DSM 12025 / NBRC 103806 / TLS) TaxID=194439 RepID=Q8KAT1_CHLTE|nr:hypothetical protein CT2074 [Chlorobaculum tepidum TLS]HBU23405.1 hypothetical protein [Chlorobaculum sp.]